MWRKKPLNWFPSPLFVVLLPRLYSGVWNMVLESKKGKHLWMTFLCSHVDKSSCGQPDRISVLLGKTVSERMNPSSWNATSTRVYPRLDLSVFLFFLFLLLFFDLFYRLLKVDYCSPPVCSPIRDTASIWDKSLSACRDHRWSLCPVHSSLDRVLKRWYWGGGKK